jgi:hypothetical protein
MTKGPKDGVDRYRSQQLTRKFLNNKKNKIDYEKT